MNNKNPVKLVTLRGECFEATFQREMDHERREGRQAVELRPRRRCGVLARGGEWGGLCRLVDQHTYALNARTGAKLWAQRTGYRTATPSPTVVNGVLYVMASIYIWAFSLP